MEQEKKKLNLKIIIPVIVAIVIIIAIVVGIGNTNKTNEDNNENGQQVQENEELSKDEQFAVDYLVEFADAPMFNNRHSIKIHKVWVYNDGTETNDNYFVAFNITYQDKEGIEVENTFGNRFLGITNKEKGTINDAYKSYLVLGNSNPLSNTKYDQNYYWTTVDLEAKEKGTLLDADKIQKAFEEAL